MSLADLLKKVFSRKRAVTTPTQEPAKPEYVYSDAANELFALAEKHYLASKHGSGYDHGFVNPRVLDNYRSALRDMGEYTILALIKATKENSGFDLHAAITDYYHRDEKKTRNAAAFYNAVGSGLERSYYSYYLEEGIHRMEVIEPSFMFCEYSELGPDRKAHADALLKVIMHFVEYKGNVSRDTSTFLKDNPEMADRVISFIETRGIGMNGFNTEVFNLAKQNSAPVLDSGVL